MVMARAELLEYVPDQRHQDGAFDRLLLVRRWPVSDGRHGAVDLAEPGEDDQRHRTLARSEIGKQVRPEAIRKAMIEQDQVVRLTSRQGEAGFSGLGTIDDEAVKLQIAKLQPCLL
jgi:hypothetical protein